MHRPADAKLYVLVRNDLAPGLQMAQAVHAAIAFSLKHPDLSESTPNVVVLAVRHEDDLSDAWEDDRSGVLFHEPDLGDEATAYATVADGARYSSLPLAGRIPAMT